MGQRAQPGRWRRGRRIAGSVVVVVVTVVGVGVATRAWFETRDATDRAAAALRDTQNELARTRDDLATATVELEAGRVTLGSELATLAARQSEREAAQGTFDATSLLLADLEAQLEAATADLEDRTARLDALDRCLVGVAEALNQAAVGDTDGLAATVRSVEDTCAEAGAEL
jgi:septal ring factor EnvC (AmiA/AmiB activator)